MKAQLLGKKIAEKKAKDMESNNIRIKSKQSAC